jgi:excisionase family DNA binding protein
MKQKRKELLRVDEVAEFFDVSRSTVYLWIDHGHLEAEKLGGVIRITQESIDKFRLVGRERIFNKYAQ